MSFNIDLNSIDKELNVTEEANTEETSNIEESNTEENKTEENSKFNINLENIVEMNDIKSDPTYIKLATALVTGRAINKLISEREEARNSEYLEEVRGIKKNVVRGGEIKSVVDCPPGYKSSKGRCVRMSSIEIIQLAKRARKAALTRHRHEGINQKSMLKSLHRSEKVRNKNSTRMKMTKMV